MGVIYTYSRNARLYPSSLQRNAYFASLAAGALLLTTQTGAYAEHFDELSAAVATVAEQIEPIELGTVGVVKGASASGTTLTIEMEAPEDVGDDIETRYSGMFTGACSDPELASLMSRGATVVYAFSTATTDNVASVELSAATCGLVTTSSLEDAHTRDIARRIETEGLEKTLGRIASGDPKALIFDGVAMKGAAATAGVLEIVVALDDELALHEDAALEQRLTSFACGDHTLTALLRGGASIRYLLTNEGRSLSLTLTEESCS